jgi:ribonuclease BN (tRNA processing enzyme)
MSNNELIITPLGTVSTFCYKDKCCPGFLVEYNNNKILLDCGNGISKHFKYPDDLNNLLDAAGYQTLIG